MLKLLLLPGMDGTGDLFRWFVEALPEGFEAAAVRYPIDRFLPYPGLMRLVEESCPSEPFVLIAESFSTPLAIQFAAAHPIHVKGIVLSAGFAVSPIRGVRQVFAKIFAPVILRRAIPEFGIRRWLVGAGTSSALVESVQRTISSVRPDVLAGRLRAILACDVRADLQRLSMPILYLQAADDRLIPASSLAEILQNKPDLRVSLREGPHLLMQRNPRQSAEVVAEFIREIS